MMDDALRKLLQELEQFGKENDSRTSERPKRMNNITADTGEFLAILVSATKAKRVLEIGTSNGYSTLWLADAVRANSGAVVTVELLDTKAALSRANIQLSGLSPWIRQELKDAGAFLREQPPASVDLLFLDSDRLQYVSWWPSIQRVIVPGGLLVVDNAVSHPSEMEHFVAQVRAASGWRSVVVPIGKGEFLAIKPRGEKK